MAVNIKTGWEWTEEVVHPDAFKWIRRQFLSPALSRVLDKPSPDPPTGEDLERWRAEAEGRGYTGAWYSSAAPSAPAASRGAQRIAPGPEILPAKALPGSSGYQSMLSEYMGWGYTRPELQGILEQGGMTSASTGDASRFLDKYFDDVYGGAPPEGITPAEWRLYPSGKQARVRTQVLLPEGMKKPGPGEWTEKIGGVMEKKGIAGRPELTVSRQGMRSFFSAEAITGTHPGIPGKEPGTTMLYKDPGDPAQRIKVAKGVQRGLVYPQVELWKGRKRITTEGPRRVGPASTRPERGVTAPMALLMEEWLPEGMMYLPKGFHTAATRRRVVDLFVPKGFTPEMEHKGRVWAKGDDVKPFAGAAPVDLRIGKGWDRASLMDYSIEPEMRTKFVGGKQTQEEGQRLRLVFGVEASPETARLSMKSLWAKHMAPMTDTERILGEEYAGRGVAQIKDPTMLPFSWWHAQPLEERAAILSDVRGQAFTKEQVANIPWQQSGREVAEHFRKKVLPDIYKEIPLHFRVHESMFRLLPDDLLDMKKSKQVANAPEFWDITTHPVPALVADWWMDTRKGWGVRQPTLPYRELRVLERVAPSIYKNVMKRAKPVMDAYKAIIGGAVGQLPEGVEAITPTTEDVGKMFAMAEERAAGAMAPEASLQHALIESAAEIWGTSPLKLGEQGFLAGPAHARRFTAEGVFEGEEVGPFATAYADALKALADNRPEQVEPAFNRALIAQEKMAGAKTFFRKMLSAHLGPRAVGDVVYASDLLKPHELAVPAGKVLRAYGLEHGSREANKFLAKWREGQITPSALVWGHPVPGEDPFRSRIQAVHPEVMKERAGKMGVRLSGRTPIQISAILAEALGRDFDEDLIWALFTGEVKTDYGAEKLTGAPRPITGMRLEQSRDVPLATSARVIEMAEQRLMSGRGSHKRGAGLKPPPGMDRAEWEKMEPLQRMQATVDPDYLATAGAGTFRESLNWMARLQSNVGKYFNLLEDVQVVAGRLDPKGGKGLRKAADTFFETVHGRTQTPALLPAGLQEIMSRLATGVEWGSYFQELKGETGERAPYKGQLPGLVGLRQKFVTGMMGADVKPSGLPERLQERAEEQWVDVVAKLVFPESSYEEAKKAIREFRAGAPGTRGAKWDSLAGSAKEWATNTPLGVVASAHVARRSLKRGGMGLEEGLMDELLEWAGLFGARRTMLSKQRLQGPGERQGATVPGLITEERERLRAKLRAFGETTGRGLYGEEVLITPGERGLIETLHQTGVPSEKAAEIVEKSVDPEASLFDPSFENIHGITRARAGLPSLERPAPREERVSVAQPAPSHRPEAARVAYEAERRHTAIIGQFSAARFEEVITELEQRLGEEEEAPLLGPLLTRGGPFSRSERAEMREWQSLRGRMTKMAQFYGEKPSRSMEQRIARAGEVSEWSGFTQIEEALTGETKRARQERLGRIRGEGAPAEEAGRAAGDLTQRFRDLGLTVKQVDSIIGEYGQEQEAVAARLGLEGVSAEKYETGLAKIGAYERYFTRAEGVARSRQAGRIGPESFQARIAGEQRALRGTLGEIGAAGGGGGPWWGGEEGPMGAKGPLRGPEQAFQSLIGYWKLMRMQRVWGMTGGAAMGQIPVAAGEEQAAARAAMATVPMGQFQQAPMAMDLRTYAAQQQRFRGQVGRAAYGAWGGVGQGLLGEGAATIAGIAGPAIGAGAVTGLAAQTLIPGLAATGVGIPVAAGVAAYGAARYAGRAMGDRERMAIAAAEGPSFLARQREQMEQAPEWWQTLMLGRDQTFFGMDVGAQQRPEMPLGEYGQQILTGSLAEMSPRARTAAIQRAVQTATEEGGPLEWMPPEAVSQQLTEWYRTTPGAENMPPSQIVTDPRFAAMAMRGIGPQAYGQIAQQWGMGTSGWERIQEVAGREPEAWMGTLQQYAPAARFGVTPEMVQERGWGGLEGQAGFQFQRLMGGDRGLWSQYAREGQAPAWMQTEGEYGMPIGTRALDPLRLSMLSRAVTPGMPSPLGVGGFGAGFGAAPAAIMREGGGAVPVLGGEAQIGVGGLWGLQDWRQAAQRAFEDWQTDFQQGSLDLQEQYTLGGGEFGRGIWAIQQEMRDSQEEYQETQLGFQARQLHLQDQTFNAQMRLQREQAGVEAGWGREDIGRRYERGVAQFGWQEADLSTRLGRQRVGFDWQEQAMARQRGRQQVGFDWQEQALVRQRERQQVGFGWQEQAMARQRARQQIGFGWQEQALGRRQERQQAGFGWQEQALGRQWERGTTQFGWAQEDMAYGRARGALQFGWQMEDVEENIRFATGRQRKRLMTQRERATVMYGMGEGRAAEEEERLQQRREWAIEDHEAAREQTEARRGWTEEDYETAREQLEQRREWAEEDFAISLEQFEQRRTWAEEDFVIAREQLEQRRVWAQEDFEIAREQLEQRRAWAEEDFATQTERLQQRRAWLAEDHERELSRHNQRIAWADQRRALAEENHREQMQLARDRHSASVARFNEQARLQNELTRLQQTYWTAQHARQQTSIDKATEHRGILRANESLTLEATRQQQVAFRQYEQFFAMGGPFLDALDNILTKLQDISVEMAIR